MESKGKMKLHKYSTFQRLIIISIAIEIMTALTHYVSNFPKSLGNICPQKLMLKSLIRNQCKTIKEIDFG